MKKAPYSRKRKTKQAKITVEKNAKYRKIINALEFIDSEYNEFERNEEEVYWEFADKYNPVEFHSYVKTLYDDLRRPMYSALWMTHPFTYLKQVKDTGNEDIIVVTLSELSKLILYAQPDHQLELYTEQPPYSVFPNIREYRKQSNIVAKDVRDLTKENIKNFRAMIKQLFGKMNKLIERDWRLVIEDFKLSNLNNLIFYTLALLELSDILIEEYPITQIQINNKLSDIMEFAEEKRMKRILKILAYE